MRDASPKLYIDACFDYAIPHATSSARPAVPRVLAWYLSDVMWKGKQGYIYQTRTLQTRTVFPQCNCNM